MSARPGCSRIPRPRLSNIRASRESTGGYVLTGDRRLNNMRSGYKRENLGIGKKEAIAMADTTERRHEVATELPSKHLPPAKYRDLPEPRSLRNYMGASVIILATALGSGELILWPYITTQVGLALVWLSVVGITVQFFLNMEVERYTLVTGETAVTGFSRMWVGWSIIFVLGAILPNTIPGWAASAAEMFSFIFGFGENAIPIVVTIFLVSIASAVTLSPVIYQVLEKVQAVLVIVILAFIALAIFIATDLSAWGGVVTEAPQGITNFPTYWKEVAALAI